MKEAVIVSAARTPLGSLSTLTGIFGLMLAHCAIDWLLERR